MYLDLVAHLAPYATWLCLAILLAAGGQLTKRYVHWSDLPDTAARWFRATLPAHPVIIAAALGATGQLPLPEGTGATRLAGAVYYAASGVCCTWVYDLVHNWAKALARVKR